MQHELDKDVSAPLAAKEGATHKALEMTQETLEQMQERLNHTNGEPEKRGPGRPPKVAMSLEQAEQAVAMARQEHQHLSEQREQSTQSLRAIGNAYHYADFDRGVRGHGKRIASDMQEHIDTIRTVAHQEGLSQSALARIEKDERVVPKMQATSAYVSGDVWQQVRHLDLMPPQSYAMHPHLIPLSSLDRLASARTVTQGTQLRERADACAHRCLSPMGSWVSGIQKS